MKEPSSLRIKRQGSKDSKSRLSKRGEKKKRKDEKEENFKKWAFSSNPQLLFRQEDKIISS